MKTGQIICLIVGLLLLLPGGCFLLFGVGLVSDSSDNMSGAGWMLLGIAAVILGLAGLMLWIAFRRTAPPATTPGDAPPPPT
jgi:hypothetical protein